MKRRIKQMRRILLSFSSVDEKKKKDENNKKDENK